MTKTKRNIVLIFMTVLLISMAILPVSAKQNKSGVINATGEKSNNYSYMKISNDYQEVARNGNLLMSADMNSGLFAIKNLSNGYVWYSTPVNTEHDAFSKGETKRFSQSQLIVGYVNKDDEIETSRIMYLDSSSASSSEVTQIDGGIQVVYTFDVDLTVNADTGDGTDNAANTDGEDASAEENQEQQEKEPVIVQVVVPIKIYLDNDHIVANVDMAGVKHTEDVIITDYSLLPYFGAGSWTDNGYIFVPDGSGALINFKGHENSASAYSQMVYGNDLCLQTELNRMQTETVRMPVFGIVNGNDNALFGIITEGAAATSIEASASNKSKGYSTVNAKINVKLVSTTTMFSKSSNVQTIFRLSEDSDDLKSFSVNYYVLSGTDADYIGMADTYRKYLTDNKKLEKNISAPTFNVDTYGAIDIKANMLGITYNKLKSITSYSEAAEIVKKLKAAGIDDISMRYFGWANNGITNKKLLTNYKLLSLLGGKSEFKKLQSYLSDNKVSFYPDADLTTFTSGSDKNAAKTAFSEVYYKYQYLRSVYAFDLNGNAEMLVSPSKLSGYADKYLSSYTKLGTNGISLSSLTSTVYSNLKRNDSFYRTKFPGVSEYVLNRAKENKLNIVGEAANDYSLKYLSKIYKAPVYCSGYDCFDSEIPFYEIIVHGYVPMTGEPMVQSTDSQNTYLKCVESGLELLWTGIYNDSAMLNNTKYDDLYGSTYSLWIDDAKAKYSEYQPLLKKIYDQQIVDHSEVLSNVTLTEYSNGIKVYVNYSDTDASINGVKVPAKGFAYKEG